MEAVAAAKWDEDDQRPTEPWLPEGDWPTPSLEVSLRAPAIPRELIDTERDVRAVSPVPRTPLASGIRTVATFRASAARARQRR